MVPITTRVVALAAVATALACGASEVELRRARTSGYQADFAVVYNQALAATRELYAQLVEDARTGIIRTAWHPIATRGSNDDPVASNRGAQLGSQGTGASSLGTSGPNRDTFFAKFTVYVAGGRPWRVRVEGEASLWKAGEVPSPLRGADVPPWLKAREDALRLAIFHRLERYAVPLRHQSSERKPAVVAPDPGRWPGLPAGAAAAIAEVDRAAAARDTGALRRLMVDDLTWSFGDAPSADVAIATWQADPTTLVELGRALGAGCAATADGEVVCPAAATGEGYAGYRAGFARRGTTWKLVLFVAGD
jgi:hypothetical protein